MCAGHLLRTGTQIITHADNVSKFNAFLCVPGLQHEQQCKRFQAIVPAVDEVSLKQQSC